MRRVRSRWRRAAWGVAALLTACHSGAASSGPPQACAAIGAVSGVQVDYGPALVGQHGPFRVKACSRGGCHVLVGVTTQRQRVLLVAEQQIHDARPVRVLVTVRDQSGREVFRGRTWVTPHKVQPNGPHCPPTAWFGRVVTSGNHTLHPTFHEGGSGSR